MERVKILDGFQPFNDVFYKSCFYNAFFPTIMHFNKSIIPFLANDILTYKFDIQNDIGIDVDYTTIQTTEEVAKKVNINIISKETSTDILRDIKEAISNNKPIILWVDAFYEESRVDTFNKVHLPHNLLVYGYNDDENIVHVMEHTRKDYLDYDKRTLSYQSITASYNEFSDNIVKKENMPSAIEVSLGAYDNDKSVEDIDNNEYMITYAQNMHKNKDLIYSNIENLKKYREVFQLYTFDETTLAQDVKKSIINFTNIINCKNAEKYKLNKILNEQCEVIDILSDIIQSWNIIRTMFAKYVYSSTYRQKDLLLAINKLDNIYKLELSYYEKMFSILEELNNI